MSSTSPALPPAESLRKNSLGHARNSSTVTAKPSMDELPPKAVVNMTDNAPRYTVFVRLPFRRGDFEDPPPVEWDSIKDAALWKIIAEANSKDLDWDDISRRFQVTLPFLLQQAAYLYERHFEAMRGIASRLGAGVQSAGAASKTQTDGASSATTGGGSIGAVAMQRTGSRGSQRGGASPLTATSSARPGSATLAVPSEPITSSGTPVARNNAPTISRTPSSATVTQSKVFTGSTNSKPLQRARRGLSGSDRRSLPSNAGPSETLREGAPSDSTVHEEESGTDSDDDLPTIARSRIPHRPPPAIARKPRTSTGASSSDGDAEPGSDDSDSPGGSFLPFAAAKSSAAGHDPSATLREVAHHHHRPQTSSHHRPGGTVKSKPQSDDTEPSASNTTTSSASSMSRHFSSDGGLGGPQSPPDALSPRHRAQLASLSPRSRRQGSEGSPSIGSSFSDLDDISQSALDDAVLSNMRGGGSSMASRMSTLRDALGRRG